jgi:hypothetical protein
MRRTIAVLTAVGTLSLLGAPAASAAVAGQISIAYNTSTENFHGKVTSSNSECVAHRTVKLFKETASGRVLEGKTTSSGSGGWHVEVMNPHGKYFGLIPAQTEMTTHCAKARSKTLDVM